MAKIVVAHRNTETKEIDLGELKNDKVVWLVLLKDNGELEHFFPNRTTLVVNHDAILFLRDRSYANAEKIIDKCQVAELKYILNDLWDANAKRWIDNQGMHDTIGFEHIMETGFTRNQIKWIENMFEILQGD